MAKIIDSKEFLPQKRNKKVLVVGAAATVAVVIIGGLIYQMNASRGDSNDRQSNTEKAFIEAGNKSRLGDDSAAALQLDQAIENETDPKQEASLYVEKANIQIAVGNQDGAIESARAAVDADPSAYTYDFLARLYANTGDKEKAIQYYEKALATFDQDVIGGYEFRTRYIREAIEQLRS